MPIKKINIQQMQQLAKAKGGLCLSNTLHDQNTKLLWQCKEGHRWEATPFSIKTRKNWCPVCAGNQPVKTKATKILTNKY